MTSLTAKENRVYGHFLVWSQLGQKPQDDFRMMKQRLREKKKPHERAKPISDLWEIVTSA